MTPISAPTNLAADPGSAVEPAVADYPHNIDKEVMVKGM